MNDERTSRRHSSAESLISVVLPVYNEERILPLLAAQLTRLLQPKEYDYEIIFVNDGSRDQSGRVLDELADSSSRIRVLHFSRNFGHQAAVQAGLAHARGDAVVIMDSDLQDDPDAIGEMIERWREGYDVVYALSAIERKAKSRLCSLPRFIACCPEWRPFPSRPMRAISA